MSITPFRENIKAGMRRSIPKKQYQPAFKGSVNTIINSWSDKALISIYSQNYGNIGNRAGEKLYKLISESEILQKSSRFAYDKNGALLITDKKILRSIMENLVFPFVNLPMNAASALLKKMQGVPSMRKTARAIYNKPFLRVSRKLNELDSKTDILKGILEKTREAVNSFAEEKGLNPDKVLKMLYERGKHPESAELIGEADKYIKEYLYKSGSKFFDKHTGNFNTAYERPLNRIVTGIIPVAFLANDAYNLSVMCGDTKEASKKEADARKKQELIRIFTTAYIQLMIFGAFTKQVNTIKWFAPVTSAATVLISEIFSRKKLKRPVFFLSKEKAKEYNQKLNNKNNNKEQTGAENTQKVKGAEASAAKPAEKIKKPVYTAPLSDVFKDFADSAAVKKQTSFGAEEKKEKGGQKALINFSTFKKGVIISTGVFLAASFLKNSPLTKNSKIVRGISDFFASIKKKFYDPYAFKNFEMDEKTFKSVTGALKDSGAEEIAEGHEFIKGMYGKEVSKGVFGMFKSVISSSGAHAAAERSAAKALEINPALTSRDKEIVLEAVKTALKLSKTEIAERKYHKAAEKAAEIIKNKKAGLDEKQLEALKEEITAAAEANAKEAPVKVDSWKKPFIDLLTEPFKFIYAAVKLPFKLLNSIINLLTSSVQKKAAQAELGKAELSAFEQMIHKTVTGIFGEKEAKAGKISQTVFANAMEQLEKKTLPYRRAQAAYNEAAAKHAPQAELDRLSEKLADESIKLCLYADTAAAKSFNGVTQSSSKNTDIALMSKLASSSVTTAFLVADNYNMVMLKSNGEDKEGAKEKANERIIQRLSGLFYQALFINWFNAAFRSTYNSSLMGMTAVAVPNTLTTEILTRKSIGMPIGRKTLDELNKIDEANENKKGLAGKYFKFMRLLTGKKPLKERLPKQKQALYAQAAGKQETVRTSAKSSAAKKKKPEKTNLINNFSSAA